MGNVWDKAKQEQVIALGRLGWSLRRIEEATGVRRETAGGYLRAAGVALRAPGGWGRKPPKAATLVITGAADSKPAIEVITGSGGPKPNENSKPANEVTTGSLPPAAAQETDRKRSSSVSEAFRETILRELSRGRNAMGMWQDLVDSHGFAGGYQSVKRLVRTLRGAASPEARVIIETRPGEECQVDYGTGPMVRDPDSGKYRHLDGCVEVEAAYYGAPPGWIGREVNVQWDAMYVRLLDPHTGELLREHLGGKRGGRRIRDEDRPRRTPPRLLQLLARAHKAGPSIGAVSDAIHARQGELAIRRIQGMLSLTKQYGNATCDQACRAKLELGVSEYQFVRRYLERSQQAPLSLKQIDPLIRELTQYRDVIQQRIQFEESKS